MQYREFHNLQDGEESKEAASAFEEEEDVSSDEEYQDGTVEIIH